MAEFKDPEYGLDYGPAPMDIEAAKKNMDKRAARTGKPSMTEDELRAVAGGNIEFVESNNPTPSATTLPTEDAPEDITSLVKGVKSKLQMDAARAANPNAAKELMSQPTMKNYGTTADYAYDLYLRGISPGMAAGLIARGYEMGDPTIKNLSDVDEFMRQYPKTTERFLRQTAISAAKPIAYGAELVGGLIGKENLEKVGEVIPGGEALGVLGTNQLTSELGKAEEWQPPVSAYPTSKMSAVYNMAPAMVGSLPAWNLAGRLATGLIANTMLQLPRYAKASAYLAAAAQQAKLGNTLIKGVESTPEIAAQITQIGKASNWIGNWVAAPLAISKLQREDDTLGTLEFSIGLGATGALFGKVGRVIMSKMPRGYKPDNLTPVVNFISSKSGIPATTVLQRMKAFEQVQATLKELGASDSIIKTYLDGVPTTAWNKGLGKVFGEYLATVKTPSEEVVNTIKLLPKSAQKAVLWSWQNASKQLDYYEQEAAKRAASKAEWKAWQKMQKGYAADFNVPVSPKPFSTTSQDYVVSRQAPLDFKGAWVYRAPGNKLEEPVDIGPPHLQTVTLRNPLSVQYDPSKEHWTEAVLKAVTQPTALGRQAAYLLNRYNLTSKEFQDVASELAFRSAKKAGHEGIVVTGKGPNDKFFIDLSNVQTKDFTASDIVAKIEKRLDSRWQDFYKNYPGILLPVAGAASLLGFDAASPEKSEAVSFPKIRELLKNVVKATGKEAVDSPTFDELAGEAVYNLGMGTFMGLNYARRRFFKSGGGTIEDLINKLEEVHKTVSKSPEKISIEIQKVPMIGGKTNISVLGRHPDIKDANGDNIIFTVRGNMNADGTLDEPTVLGYGPGLSGGKLSEVRRLFNEANAAGVGSWFSGNRLSGAAGGPKGKGHRVSKGTFKYGVPIAVGYSLYDTDPADAMMTPKAVAKALKKHMLDYAKEYLTTGKDTSVFKAYKEGVVNFKGGGGEQYWTVPSAPVTRFIESVRVESPVTADLMANIIRTKAMYGARTTVKDVALDYERVSNSLKNDPFEIREFSDVPSIDYIKNAPAYHGTKRVFDEFDPQYFDDYALFGPGIYSTSKPEVAVGYPGVKPQVIKDLNTPLVDVPNIRSFKAKPENQYLDIDSTDATRDHPFVQALYSLLKDEDVKNQFDDYFKANSVKLEQFYEDVKGGEFGYIPNFANNQQALVAAAEQAGYHGFSHIGGRRSGGGNLHRVWITFMPKDLIPAFGNSLAPHKPWASIAESPRAWKASQAIAGSFDENLKRARVSDLKEKAGLNEVILYKVREGEWTDDYYHASAMQKIPGTALTTEIVPKRLLPSLKIPESDPFSRTNMYKLPEGYDSAKGDYFKYAEGLRDPLLNNPNTGYLEFDIGHPLAGEVGKIGGYIDPVDGKWFVREKEVLDAGIGKAGLASLVAAGIASKYITGIKPTFTKLALIAAATGAAGILGADEANAMPYGKYFGKGMKGVADDLITEIAKASAAGKSSAPIVEAFRQEAVKKLPKSFKNDTEKLFAAADIAPEQAFDPEFKDLLMATGPARKDALTFAPNVLKNPAFAIDHPTWDKLFGQFITKQSRILTGENSAARELIEKMKVKFKGLTREHVDLLEEAVQGLERDSKTGILHQTASGIDPKYTELARWWVETVDDNIFELYHGIKPQAQAILREYKNLPETEDTWRMLRWLQDQPKVGPTLIWKGARVPDSAISASERMRGMLHWEPWQKLDTQNSRSGILSRFPIENERAVLKKEVESIAELYPNGAPEKVQGMMDGIKARLVQLDVLEEQVRTRRQSDLHRIPSRHYWGPRSEEAAMVDLPGISRIKDAPEHFEKYINGALSQIFFNEQLYWFKGATAFLESGGQVRAAEWARLFLNVKRGMRSVNEDVYWASQINRVSRRLEKTLPGWKANVTTIQRIRNGVSKAQQLMYIGKLGLNLSFPITNLTQPIMTGTVLPFRRLANGLAKTATNWTKARAEAASMHILKAESQYAEEASVVHGAATKVLDAVPTMTENFNRVWVYQAAKEHALDRIAKGKLFKDGKLPLWMRSHFNYEVLDSPHPPEEVAKAYAAAVVHATQFMFGVEGKPLMYSGGAPRRLAGQFKSFQAGYANLMLAALKDDKPAAMRLLGTLLFIGGAKAAVGDQLAQKIIDVVRAGIAAAGGDPDWVPDGSPLGKMLELTGIDPLVQLSKSVQLVGAAQPINIQNMNPITTDTTKFLDWFAGPTFSTARQSLSALGQGVTGQISMAQMMSGVARPIAPGVVAGLEGLQEAGLTPEILNEMGYRGGIYNYKTGDRLVRDRDKWDIAARALNLQPSVRSQKYQYQNRILDFMKRGDTDKALEVLNEAQDRGFIFTKNDIRSMRRRAMSEDRPIPPNKE